MQRDVAGVDICLLIVFFFTFICVLLFWFPSGLSPQAPYLGLACFFISVGIPVVRLCSLSGVRRMYCSQRGSLPVSGGPFQALPHILTFVSSV